MRVLVVTNMTPDAAAPARGRFVRDQVAALARAGAEMHLHSFPVGSRQYPRAVRAIRRLLRDEAFDLVHAHYGLAGWCALLAGARPLVVTFHGTDVRHPVVGPMSRRLAPRLDLVAGASRALFDAESGRPGLPRIAGASAVLPCGADLDGFKPSPRPEARSRLGLDPDARYLLFPASSSRRVKRHDRAVEVARLADAELLAGGAIEPDRMVDWINAANAVLVTSDNEGFGLAAIEALACDVPVLSTPVGIAPALLGDVEGCLVAPFEARRWAGLARAHLDQADPRVEGRERARWLSVEPMAQRVLLAYRELLGDRVGSSTGQRRE